MAIYLENAHGKIVFYAVFACHASKVHFISQLIFMIHADELAFFKNAHIFLAKVG